MERIAEREIAVSRSGNGAGSGGYKNRLDRGTAAFTPLTLRPLTCSALALVRSCPVRQFVESHVFLHDIRYSLGAEWLF